MIRFFFVSVPKLCQNLLKLFRMQNCLSLYNCAKTILVISHSHWPHVWKQITSLYCWKVVRLDFCPFLLLFSPCSLLLSTALILQKIASLAAHGEKLGSSVILSSACFCKACRRTLFNLSPKASSAPLLVRKYSSYQATLKFSNKNIPSEIRSVLRGYLQYMLQLISLILFPRSH